MTLNLALHVLQFIVVAAGLVVVIVNFAPKRLEKEFWGMSVGRIAALAAGVAVSLAGLASPIIEGKIGQSHQRQRGKEAQRFEEKIERLESSNDLLLKSNEAHLKSNEESEESRKKLLQANETLQGALSPFQEIAERIYPAVEQSAALAMLRQEMDELAERTEDIDSRTANRQLDDNQRAILSKFLAQREAGSVRIRSPMGDHEAQSFAKELADAIAASGWSIDLLGQSVWTAPIEGIIISVGTKDEAETPADAKILFSAFMKMGLNVTAEYNEQMGVDRFQLIVGSKK